MRQKFKVSPKTALRRIIILTSSVVTILSVCLIIFINLSNSKNAFAAPSMGDYRTAGSGDWSSVSTWQRFDGSTWMTATVVPTTADNVISILNGHTVTISSNTTIDQVVVDEGGFLIVNNGILLTVANASGLDLVVFGTIKNAGIITQNNGSIVFEASGKYQHNFSITPGTIPSATWNRGSTCEIIGYTTNPEAPGGLQAFSNFIWNCPQQTERINLNGGITNILDDLTILNTGSGELDWTNSAINCTIGGNFIVNGGTYIFNKSVSASTLTIDGDYVQSGGSVSVTDADNSNSTLNISGTFILTDGIANFVKGIASTCSVNISSDMTITGGSIVAPGNQSSYIQFVFKKPGRQYYTASGYSITGNVDYIVNAGSMLDLGTSVVQGRNFTVASYGGLVIGSSEGIMQTGQQGNVQVNGIRSFSSSADYEYAANASQFTGTGLPSTVRNLNITNSNNVSLTRPLTISGVLTFINGNIITADNDLYIQNSSTSAISGYSSTNYVNGKLRRSVIGSGSYDFPIGTATEYEFINISLSSATGVSNLTASFVEEDPIAGSSLNDVKVKGVSMTDMIQYGFWSIKPDAQITGGTYSLSVTGRGQSTLNNAATFSLLNRQAAQTGWVSEGTHNSNTQTVNAGAVTAARTSLNVFGDFAIAYGDYLLFQNPTLISGIASQVNAVYLFPEICSNVDAWVQVSEISEGTTLTDIDDQASCYKESWQPVIQVPANSTGYVKWNITLKVAGTSNDTILPQLAVTAINVDGIQNVKEFINAYVPYSYATTLTSSLTVSSEDGWYKATSAYNQANCDTASHESMFQVSYNNIRSFQIVTGLKNNSSVKVKRPASVYFKTFLNGTTGIPVRLVYFTATPATEVVLLKWATASEDNLDYFTVERSADGENFTAIKSQKGAGNSNSILYYTENDADPLSGISYYRLRQIDKTGRYSFSEIQSVNNSDFQKSNSVDILALNPNPFTDYFTVDFKSISTQSLNFSIINSSGKQVYRSQFSAIKGANTFKFPNLSYLNKGVYVLIISDETGQVSKRIIKS